ncbi:MAG: cupin-like domain-containing protein [Alteraurantiacibacter sp.]
MIEPANRPRGAALTSAAVFGPSARADFASSYPEGPHKLAHELHDHPLLAIDALAALGEALPATSVEYNRGDVPVGVTGKPGATGLAIGETIRNIATSNSWAALKNIEQSSTYAGLLLDILGELKPIVERRTGKMLKPQGFIFISSPDAVTPYHFDPEHNILLQLRGTKVMTVFPAGANEYAPDRVHESYHRGGARELTWQDDFVRDGMPFPLEPGEALFVPVMAPHFVNNGPQVSISLSVTWRSEWSFAEADARAFNGLLRKWGLDPRPPGRWPSRNRLKAMSWRLLRRLPGV